MGELPHAGPPGLVGRLLGWEEFPSGNQNLLRAPPRTGLTALLRPTQSPPATEVDTHRPLRFHPAQILRPLEAPFRHPEESSGVPRSSPLCSKRDMIRIDAEVGRAWPRCLRVASLEGCGDLAQELGGNLRVLRSWDTHRALLQLPCLLSQRELLASSSLRTYPLETNSQHPDASPAGSKPDFPRGFLHSESLVYFGLISKTYFF